MFPVLHAMLAYICNWHGLAHIWLSGLNVNERGERKVTRREERKEKKREGRRNQGSDELRDHVQTEVFSPV